MTSQQLGTQSVVLPQAQILTICMSREICDYDMGSPMRCYISRGIGLNLIPPSICVSLHHQSLKYLQIIEVQFSFMYLLFCYSVISVTVIVI